MHNVTSLQCNHLKLGLPTAPLTPLLTSEPSTTLHTVHRTGLSSFSLEARSLRSNCSYSSPSPPLTADSSNPSTTSPSPTISAPAPTSPTALTPVDAGLLLALRSGELYTVSPTPVPGLPSTAVPIGDVTDPDPQRSGVLAAATSPDGTAVALISPVSLTILDAAFTPIAELFHDRVIASHAVLRWRHDSEHLVVLLRGLDGCVSGFVADRAAANVIPLQLGDVLPQRAALVVDWQPRPNAPLCVAGPGACVSFLERNGLRLPRADLIVSAAEPPRVLRWSPDARLLAIAAEEGDDEAEGDAWRIAFYTHLNYVWYCKKRVIVQHRVVDILWDEDEQGLATIVCERTIISLRLSFVPSTITRIRGHAVACVVNGHSIELTNLSRAVVPPPLCHGVLTFEEDVDEVCASPTGDTVAALLSDGSIETAVVSDALGRPRVARDGANSEEIHAERSRWVLRTPREDDGPDEIMQFRKPVMLARDYVAVVRPTDDENDNPIPGKDSICVYRLPEGTDYAPLVSQMPADGRITATFYSEEAQSLVLATSTGSVSRLSVGPTSTVFQIATESGLPSNVIALQELPIHPDRTLTLLHDETGGLEVIELTTQKRLSISSDCTSFCVHEGFLCFTTRTHLLYCATLDSAKSHKHARAPSGEAVPSLLDALDSSYTAGDGVGGIPRIPENAGATRPIDRGSLLVAGLPGDVGLVLQAPRGNLETIAPRPIVFDVVHRLALERNYARAFSICRRQRVSMSHVVEADEEAFLTDIPRFVAQVGDAAQLSVFLTHLEGSTERINRVCDAVVKALQECKDSVRFTNAILTGLMRRTPRDMEGAMRAVRVARDESVDDGYAAVEFLNVLVKDGMLVYREALGTYDIGLAAFVAEAGQLDPAEYAAELHALRGMCEWERRYTIELRLTRYSNALDTLFEQGEGRYAECQALIHEHKLYDDGLRLFSGDENIRKELMTGYAGHLEQNGEFERAGGLFMQVGLALRAGECYRQGGQWELAVSAVWRAEGVSESERGKLVGNIADELNENGLARESGHIRARWLGDFEGALEVLTKAEQWEAAFEVAAAAAAAAGTTAGSGTSGDRNTEANGAKDGNADSKSELDGNVDWWATVRDAVEEGCENVRSMLDENSEKVRSRGQRLEALRAAAAPVLARLAARGGADDGESDAVSSTTASSTGSSVLSDVTFGSKGTTGTGSAMTSVYASSMQAGVLGSARLDKQAAKRAAKAARKRVREGDPRERDYLAANLRRLVPTAAVRERVGRVARAAEHVDRGEEADAVRAALRRLAVDVLRLPQDVVDEQDRAALRALL